MRTLPKLLIVAATSCVPLVSMTMPAMAADGDGWFFVFFALAVAMYGGPLLVVVIIALIIGAALKGFEHSDDMSVKDKRATDPSKPS